MKKFIAITAIMVSLLPAVVSAAPTTKTKAVSTVYVCSTCHMKFSATEAKKDHFKDPMDGGTLVPVKASSKKSAVRPMGGMSM
jgi:hypothetical protein